MRRRAATGSSPAPPASGVAGAAQDGGALEQRECGGGVPRLPGRGGRGAAAALTGPRGAVPGGLGRSREEREGFLVRAGSAAPRGLSPAADGAEPVSEPYPRR